jgi:hypothetical protein
MMIKAQGKKGGGGGGGKTENAVSCTSVENCLVTFYSFVKVVSIFVYYS